jgi:DNA-binding response OmpR family regulator
MPDARLQGARVLVAEDEYLLADDLSRALGSAGAEVAGPVSTVQQAMRLIAEGRLDAAVLDVTLRDGKVFPVADLLAERGVPFAFATGYDQSALPDRFGDRPRIQKPFSTRTVLSELSGLLPPA